MRKILVLLFAFILNSHLWAGYTDLPGKVAALFAKQVRKEDGLHVACVGGAMMGDIQMISLCAQAEIKLTLPEFRGLIVKECQQFVAMVNENIAIRPYLHDYPFTSHNIEIMYLFQASKGGKIKFPYASGAMLFDGKIVYTFYDENEKSIKPEISETYEEACGILQQK